MNTEPSPLSVPAAPQKTNGLALASLILGILSVLVCGVGIIFSKGSTGAPARGRTLYVDC